MATRKPPNEIEPETCFVALPTSERQIVPAVQLEQRQIKMTYLTEAEMPPASIAAATTSSGESPMSADITLDEDISGQSIAMGTSGGQLLMPQGLSPSPDVSQVLEFFEEQDKSSKGEGVKKVPVKPRTPSPSPVRQSVGLDHLDNLVRLMEQLSNLKGENSKLKRKCAYLESTKSILEVKTALEQEIMTQSEYSYTRSKQASYSKHKVSRPRLPSAEDMCFFELEQTASDSYSPKRSKHVTHKRSRSTGSLDIPSEILEQSGEEDNSDKLHSKSYEKTEKSKGLKSSSSKRKSKVSNWVKFKRVISKPRFPEDIGFSLKSIKDLGKGSKELTVPISTMENRSVDSGVGSGLEVESHEVRRSTSSGEPSSPTQGRDLGVEGEGEEEDEDEEFGTEIWMGDPEWLEKHESEIESDVTKEVVVLNTAGEQYLNVAIPRRKSSPSLLDETPDLTDEYLNLRRSSSYKGRSSHGDLSELKVTHTDSPKLGKKKPTWGKRVKSIVHTRKDSIKRKLIGKKGELEHSNEELLESEVCEERYAEQEGPLGRSTPKTSPICIPRHKSSEESDQGARARTFLIQSGSIDMEALLGGVSDEFTKKIEQWEEKKSQQSSVKGEKGREERVPRDSREVSPEGASMSAEPTVVNVEELQQKLTESFSKKLEEWERIKYRKDSASPPLDNKDATKVSSQIHKDDRLGSRKVKADKDRSKLERRRERELQRVEREQQKLERDRIRIEKERLKALEREARIEKMKGRLSQPDLEAKLNSPIYSPLGEYKVTTEFARKLYEWEQRREGASSASLEQQRICELPGDKSKGDSEGEEHRLAKGQKPPPLTLQPCFDSPEEASPGDKSSEASFGDDTSLTVESMTESNLTSLEKANCQLMERLHEKEIEYEGLQEDVKGLAEKLDQVKFQHSKDIGEQHIAPPLGLATQVQQLEAKIDELKDFGENLALSMESAAICKWQSIEGQENVNSRLVQLLEEMKGVLMQASQSEECFYTSDALGNFEKLYGQAMQLQVQLSNLRLSQLERNKEIMTMKRQLLLQEANNLLLQADITRRETELHYYKSQTKRGPSIKRWNTFSIVEGRTDETKDADSVPPYKRYSQILKDSGEPSVMAAVLETPMAVNKKQVVEPLMDQTRQSTASSAQSMFYLDNFPESKSELQQVSDREPIEKEIERVETEDSVQLSEGQARIINVSHSPGGEMPTVKLPTASISLPQPYKPQPVLPQVIRQQAMMLLCRRAPQREDETFTSNLVSRSATKPPQVKNSKEISRHKSGDSDFGLPARLPATSEASSRPSLSDLTSDSMSQSMDDTEDSLYETDVFFSSVSSLKQVKSAPASQCGRGSHRDTDYGTKVHISPAVSPIISKRRTHPASLPRTRQVSYAQRIRPAEELMEESRRYRKGHSVYMSRILRKYATTGHMEKHAELVLKGYDDKENVTEGYVKSIVKKMSRESTPDYESRIHDIVNSSQTKSTFVPSMVQKLSTASEPDQTRSSVPLSDLTNGGGKKVKYLAEAYSSTSSISAAQTQGTLRRSESPLGFSSMPTLQVEQKSSDFAYRERAATTATCQDDPATPVAAATKDSSPQHSIPSHQQFPKLQKVKKLGKVKMGTIGFLCQQTMVDLGITQVSQCESVTHLKLTVARPPGPRSGEGASGTTTEDRRSRTSWIQKKFFKTSKS
ncbi:uncharacterized protein LOC110457666 isoform X2 [Mizuhopecten yessoensis]|uniref:Uncharacterized protein n=1 Tax=Mizuhopecten yessoensis TaxID=6573 RepID=A0A210Q8A3_MIZYE|nr:uncharacterized protein LOC110457666 isoform X2 [Mizuhopecten yessoensis]OWF44945.1 hypothetical protein KP79_PYT01644 [Mizuhopecten yessoensis]